jgi:hypothetical protein
MARSPTRTKSTSQSRTGTGTRAGTTSTGGRFTSNQWTQLMKHLQPLKPQQQRRAATKASSRSKSVSSGGSSM